MNPSARALSLFTSLLLLCNCSMLTERAWHGQLAHLPEDPRLASCQALFAATDARVRQHAANDAQYARLPAFPYLRSSRFLASFRHEVMLPETLPAWLQAMRKLDREARRYELQNIAGADDEAGIEDKLSELDACAKTMMQADLANAGQIEKIRAAAKVADSYLDMNRLLGLYPLSSLFVRHGVQRLQAELREGFKRSSAGEFSRSYAPPATHISADTVTDLLKRRPDNALAIPGFNAREREQLFNYFAPVWMLTQRSTDDYIGSPYWTEKTKLNIDINDSVVYRYLSYSRLKEKILIQFNYVIWFPARTARSRFDILAGAIDGITWRVSVDTDGKIILYDAMHNCGCYHMFFPLLDSGLSSQPLPQAEEPLLTMPALARPRAGQRTHVYISAGTHYIEAVKNQAVVRPGTTYRMADYNSLRALNDGSAGTQSMFDSRGLVPGTQRQERWLLWPMGVASAGAMRQRGQHATAFVGRRHFDDPYLLEYFMPD